MADPSQPDGKCRICGRPESLTPVVAVVLVWAPALAQPYPVIPGAAHRVCDNDGCASVLRFIERAIGAHAAISAFATSWTSVQIDWCDADLKPWRIKYRRPEMASA